MMKQKGLELRKGSALEEKNNRIDSVLCDFEIEVYESSVPYMD